VQKSKGNLYRLYQNPGVNNNLEIIQSVQRILLVKLQKQVLMKNSTVI
jgi:hypothetical protein